MIEVAIVSMEQALRADGEELPAGSGRLERHPLDLPGLEPAGPHDVAPQPSGSRGPEPRGVEARAIEAATVEPRPSILPPATGA
jgi:hypothetical protein